MEFDVGILLKDRPEILLFLVIGIGYLIGKIKIKGFELSSAGGVLFAALFFGHYGYELPKIIETIGFIFFIYSVGFQSGPGFVASFKRDGLRYILLSLTIAFTGFSLALFLAWIFDLDKGYAAGILGGAMTSTPTLAAAQDAINSGLVDIGSGLSLNQINGNITVAYAITYVFGLIGLIIFMKLFPRIMRIDLPAEAKKLAKEMDIDEDDGQDDEYRVGKKGLPMVRMYRVANAAVADKSLNELKFFQATGSVILSVQRNGDTIEPGIDTQLVIDDKVVVIGYFDELRSARELLGGREVDDDILKEFSVETHQVVVSNSQAVDRTIRDLGIVNTYSCFITKLTRENREMPISPDSTFEKGDMVVLTGIKEKLIGAVKLLGHQERPIHETDLLTFAMGIVGGIAIGTITIKLGSLPLGIGTAGGLLVMGLLIGHLRSRHPTFGRVPAAARYILMEMGILFFLAGVGLRAGHGLLEGLAAVGPQIFISGIVVTVLPVISGFLVGTYLLKMNPVILLGAVTGSMTSTPSLVIVNKTAQSSLPALGYAGAYAFANIILTLAGQLIMLA